MLIVAGQLPLAVELHDAAHLPIGRGLAELLRPVQGQVDAEGHHAVVAGRLAKLHLPHAPGQVAKQERRC